MNQQLKDFLDRQVDEYNRPAFVAADPVSIPHRFTQPQDIEIAGFFAAVFAWGNRTTIINKTTELMALMNDAPHRFIREHSEEELKSFLSFRHRTFNATDLLYFLLFLKQHYSREPSLETAFSRWIKPGDETVEGALQGFHDYFFSLDDAPGRTRKHIATPARGSTCKRLCMFLRWMVRRDERGVDFGLWQRISPAQLVCPVDVHAGRVARQLGLISRKQTDWQAALELTQNLKAFDAADPVKYDFALFGSGVAEKP